MMEAKSKNWIELYNSIPKQITIVRHENVGYTRAIHNIVNFCKAESQSGLYVIM